MTILEFIRKNSLLVLIVIVGVGIGLVMMDYSGKASAFSRNFYISVDGTGYDYPEAMSLGENGKEFLGSLLSATQHMTDEFDTDGDGKFSEQEEEALRTWLKANPDVEEFSKTLNTLYSMWSYGAAEQDDNIAVNRAMLHAQAEALGLHPSEEQIDAYIRRMPPFRKSDGSFNTELYQRLAGIRNGTANRVQEEIFRGVVADIMRWETLQAMLGTGTHFNTRTQLSHIDATMAQRMSGRTAWLPNSAVPAPAEPTDEELKAYWEEHKQQYKSPERRIVSVYTLAPGAESNMENLLFTTDAIMQELSQANGQGLDKLLADTAENAEFDPFTYLQENGATHTTYPLLTQEQLSEQLKDTVNYDGEEAPLSGVAFSELSDAPSVEKYEAAAAAGAPEKHLSIKQIRGFYTSTDGKLKLVRIEAVEQPTVLPYEEAHDKALADFRAERTASALSDYARKLYDDMTAADSLDAAFALATERGAKVENYGPLDIQYAFFSLPEGVTLEDVLSTHSGKLTPLAVQSEGARVTSVEKRTVADSPELTIAKRARVLPDLNSQLRSGMIQDWINAGFSRFEVILSPSVRIRGSRK